MLCSRELSLLCPLLRPLSAGFRIQKKSARSSISLTGWTQPLGTVLPSTTLLLGPCSPLSGRLRSSFQAELSCQLPPLNLLKNFSRGWVHRYLALLALSHLMMSRSWFIPSLRSFVQNSNCPWKLSRTSPGPGHHAKVGPPGGRHPFTLHRGK